MKKLIELLAIFLIVTSCSFFKAKPTKFDGDWQRLKTPEGGHVMCLPLRDIIKLRDTLVRCKRSY